MSPQVVRRHWFGLVFAVVSLAAVAVFTVEAWQVTHPRIEQPSATYCYALDPIDQRLRDLRAGVTDRADPMTGRWHLTLPALKAMKGLVYQEKLANEGPAGHDADSHVVVQAIRRAIEGGSPKPLDQPDVQAAAARLRDPTAQGCARLGQ